MAQSWQKKVRIFLVGNQSGKHINHDQKIQKLFNDYRKMFVDLEKKYEQIPDTSPLKLTVLLNTAEIYAELGDLDRALSLSNRAYSLAPQMPETQLCYADKLHKKGKSSMIPEVIKLSPNTPLQRKMESLWIIGMQQCITECDINTQQEKIRDLCRKLLVISPDNSIALEYLRKLH